jgi:hypothetical protein
MTKSITLNSSFALLAIAALVLALVPAFAFAQDNNWKSTTITTSNSADVSSTAVAISNSGVNEAAGSFGGDGGNGGSILGGEGEVDDSITGNGGAGGNGGEGGLVQTGNASATSLITTDVNNTDIAVEDVSAPSEGDENADEFVMATANSATTNEVAIAGANSGINRADGSRGGRGGDAGSISSGADEVDDSGTGAGGNGGSGATGGTVMTGTSSTSANTVSVVNRTLLRVQR